VTVHYLAGGRGSHSLHGDWGGLALCRRGGGVAPVWHGVRQMLLETISEQK